MNISIIGSCQSRDLFNSKFVANYKELFQVQSYYTMTSMLSVMSKPVKYNFRKLVTSGLSDYQMEHWYYELEKPMLKTLESLQPDVILMDFYADARYGARFYGGEYVVDRLAKLRHKDIIRWDKFGIVYSYTQNTEDFITMWKNRFDRFMMFANEKLPNTQIIINTVKGTNVVLDKDGNKYFSPKIEDLDVDEINHVWEIMDNYAIVQHKLKALRFEKEYYLDPEYDFGLGVAMVHFHKEYYQDCFKKLVIATNDREPAVRKESHLNLVRDSAFDKELDEWTSVAGEFEFITHGGYNGIKAIDCREELGEYRPQLWTKPIEIFGDGETEYTLSFYMNVEDPSVLGDEEVVFGVRTFKTMRESKAKEAIEEQSIVIDKSKLKEGKDYRHVITFKPNGKFIRLAPFMFGYKPGIEYSRIKLERASEVSDYSK